eukprot:symbB.v1.2.011750.t3/scaffold750.1/size323489/2
MKWCWAIGLAFLQLARAPIPCKPTLAADVQVGDVYAQIGPSKTILHEEERDCAIVTFGYEGMIVITCYEGTLNVTTEGCSPRRCQPFQSITVRLGEYSVSAFPLAIIASGGQETRFCRNLNPLFRNTYIMYCNFGEVTVDTSQCVTQPGHLERRTVGLSDGALLMLGGLGNEGPIREVWLWQPTPGLLEGTWHQSLKRPPWSGRFGSAAVRISSADANQEQVVLIGGNDNQNRGDVWRWLRYSAPIELLGLPVFDLQPVVSPFFSLRSLADSEATGSQEQDCVLETSQLLTCNASAGVSGRKWHISHYLEMSTEIHIDILHGGGSGGLPLGAAGVGAAVIAIELDTCRQLFRAKGGRWSTTGCTGDQPPWARAEQPAIRLGPSGAAMPGQLRSLRFVLDRMRQEVIMYSNDVMLVPAGAEPGQFGVPVGGGACRDYSNVQNGSLVCPNVQPPVSEMHVRVVELVVWPEASLEVRRLGVLAPAEYWQPGPFHLDIYMPQPVGHAANILWQQAIQTERKAAVQWEDSWGFLRAERPQRPAHSASVPSLRTAGQKVLEPKASSTEGMSRSGALLGLKMNVPRDRFRKPATTQQERGLPLADIAPWPARAAHVAGLPASSRRELLCGTAVATAACRAYGKRRSKRHSFVVVRSAATDTATWTGEKVRDTYISFFVEKKKHDFVQSSPVVPLSDPTLLFANAGMNQFKPIFLGQLEPNSPLQGVNRAANSQKCIRAGGKHNDLDDVGKDVYHHTFFEMLGNWSFGDYFKEEAIDWAWELLTEVYGLDSERLYASYFGGDEELGLPEDLEAKELWLRHLPESRVLPFGKKDLFLAKVGDNFWEMGATGPCGPCSELHYDRIGGRDASALVNADDPDVIEIWNLVFMQFFRGDDGRLTELPSRHIDTGMGLERVTSVLQDTKSNYDTDIFGPLLAAVHDLVGGEAYQGKVGSDDIEMRDTAYRIVVDHARTLTMAVADGRGYVLRRILRRAVRYGRSKLDAPPGFFSKLVPKVVESLSPGFPDLTQAAGERVQAILQDEEVAFDRTVDRGMQFFDGLKAELEKENAKVVPGEQAFLLYDSHGFPLDLTEQMALEAGLTVDVAGFEAAMQEQKERSRAALREQQAAEQGLRPLQLVAEQTAWLSDQKIKVTDDLQKYTWSIRPAARVEAIYTEQGFVNSTDEIEDESTSVGVVLDSTAFYAEAGGQVGDLGLLSNANGEELMKVKVVQVFAGYVLHVGPMPVSLKVGEEVFCEVDYEHRSKVAPNHTMTHVLNWALREVLGEGLDQRGSLVTAERLRFDFAYEASSGVAVEDLAKVESLVQKTVDAGLTVTSKEVALADAQVGAMMFAFIRHGCRGGAEAISGLRSMAGEAYPDPVRVVTVGSPIEEVLADPSSQKWASQSVEFCGGTHISTTSEAKHFVLLEEKDSNCACLCLYCSTLMADYVGDAVVYYKGAGEEDPILTFAFHTQNHQLLLDVSAGDDAKKESFRKRYEREVGKMQDKYKDLEPEFSDDDMNATLEESERKRGWQYPLTKTQQKKEFGCVPADQQRFLWRLQDGHLDIVEDYLQNPKMKKAVDLNRYDDEGLTPLHHAAKLGHAEIVKVLIEGKADPLLRDKVNGLTPLDFASAGRWDSGPHTEVVKAIQDLELR